MLQPENVRPKSLNDRLLDAAVGGVWALVAGAYLRRLATLGGTTDLGLFVFYTLVAFNFLRRRPAFNRPAWWENVLALVGVFLPIAGLRPAAHGWPLVSAVVMAISLIGMVAALSTLGRSFGITPADRGVVTHGFYGLIRHPLYAFETLFFIGYLAGNPSPGNVLVLVLATAVTVARILREEQVIAGYHAYAHTVRWRLLPLIW